MPSLSERLKDAIRPDGWMAYASDDYKLAITVCALVEAFQAAEQEWQSAAEAEPKAGPRCVAAWEGWRAAKARLLEVNLG